MLFITSVHWGIPLDIIFKILLLKHLIMQIVCQELFYYLLQVQVKKSKPNYVLYL